MERLCKCNNCNTVLIDKNPQINAKLHNLIGSEKEMEWSKNEFSWVCPVCKTDDYLIDL